jgi:enamine deaminase RidA (YjgF/YER057c/UK114 family)
MEILQPPGWAKPKGYSNGVAAEGRLVFVAGQVGWNPATCLFETDDFAGQFRQTLLNTAAVLAAGGAKPEHIVRMTWFITTKQEYLNSLKEIGRAYRDIIGAHYPPMAAIGITALMEDRAKVEIETTAVVPRR